MKGVRVYESLGKSVVERKYGSPCYICREFFSVGDEYFCASVSTFTMGQTIETHGRVHVSCAQPKKQDNSFSKGVRNVG